MCRNTERYCVGISTVLNIYPIPSNVQMLNWTAHHFAMATGCHVVIELALCWELLAWSSRSDCTPYGAVVFMKQSIGTYAPVDIAASEKFNALFSRLSNSWPDNLAKPWLHSMIFCNLWYVQRELSEGLDKNSNFASHRESGGEAPWSQNGGCFELSDSVLLGPGSVEYFFFIICFF